MINDIFDTLTIEQQITVDPVFEISTDDINNNPEEGLKYDDGKLRMDLIPPVTYEALGRVLTYGAKKYTDNSWQGVERKRYVAALLRHFIEYMKDPQSIDSESGLKHIEHVLCNAMFLNYFENIAK